MKNLLIIGINYAPEETGIAPYTTALAEYATRCDYKVTVLTGMPHYPQWRTFETHRDRWMSTEHLGDVEVHRIRHHVPHRQSAWQRALYEASFLLGHGLSAAKLARPDVILGIVPILSDGILARLLSARFGVPYGLIVQDLMGAAAEQSGIRGGKRVARLTRIAEGWAARGAFALGAISEGFFPYLESLGVPQERIVHLPNWTHIDQPEIDRTAMRRHLGWNVEDQVVLHAGNMGMHQGLAEVVRIARIGYDTHDPVRFVFLGDGNQREALEADAARLPNVTFLDPVPYSEFPAMLAAADALLVSERAEATSMSLPSKLTSYFAAGRPIVALVPEGGATAREIARSGAGIIVPAGHSSALLPALGQLRLNPGLAEQLANAGPRYATRHLSAEAAFQRFDEFLGRGLNLERATAKTNAPQEATT